MEITASLPRRYITRTALSVQRAISSQVTFVVDLLSFVIKYRVMTSMNHQHACHCLELWRDVHSVHHYWKRNKKHPRCIIALKATSVLSFIPHFPLSWIVIHTHYWNVQCWHSTYIQFYSSSRIMSCQTLALLVDAVKDRPVDWPSYGSPMYLQRKIRKCTDGWY